MQREDIRFFDPKTEWSVVERRLPHWSQAGVVTFITWRLADSLPKSVLERLDRDIETLLRGEGFDPNDAWKQHRSRLAAKKRTGIARKLFAVRDKYLDQGFGQCQLASPELSEIVVNSLRHFDEDRYFLTDGVIMPNHVHFLCAFRSEEGMMRQCADWKRFTARAINKQLGRTGEFWQVDQFDHLVRGLDDFEHFRQYIADNPINAQLKSSEYHYYQKQL